jgi:hypothetical protein
LISTKGLGVIARSATRFPRVVSSAATLREPTVVTLALSAIGVVVLAEIGTDLPLLITALILTGVCGLIRPVFGAAVVLVAASDPSLFRGHALGRLAVVDLLIAAVVVRAALTADRSRPSWLEWSALGFVAAGGIATTVAHAGSALTAFGRVSSYVILGLVVGRALGVRERLLLARALVGAQAGQSLAALTSITGTTTTAFPLGRYLGTLGDPAQFGIPIAFAAVLLAVSPSIVRNTLLRTALLILFVAAIAGSATRSAWAVAAVGALLALVQRIGSGRSAQFRVALGIGLLAALCGGTILVVVGASALGLNPKSAELRRSSIKTASTYLVHHPLRPLGLGNNPHRQSNKRASDGGERRKVEDSVTYNTWLAVAISLGVLAAGLLAALAVGAPYHAYRLEHDALAIALVAMLVPSLTEDFVYATSMVTLVWLAILGLTVSTRVSANADLTV